jgi:hypothetical protein
MDYYPSSSHLIYHSKPEGDFELDTSREGKCCFCSYEGKVLDSGEVINNRYFNNNDLKDGSTGDICSACAYCMNNKPLKNGHWIVNEYKYNSISTSELYDILCDIELGKIETPFAFHVSKNPILSEHGYLYTPVCYSKENIIFDYNGTRIRSHIDEIMKILDAVEILRYHKFRLDEIRTGRANISNIESVGMAPYQSINTYLDDFRTTALLEFVIKTSRSRSDQSKTEDNITNILDKYDWK